jgi:hypothetical protein
LEREALVGLGLKEAIEKGVKELHQELGDTLPDIIYITDCTEEMGCEEGERFFGASEKRDDLVGCGETASVGIYKLIATQRVKKVEKTKTLGTDFVPPQETELNIELGKGGITVAGEAAEIDGVGFAAVFVDE